MPLLEFKHQFNYRPLFLETGSQKLLTQPLPVIEVALSFKGVVTTALALVDSGSTFSLFSREVGDRLGIEVTHGRIQRLTTLGGPLLAFGHEVDLQIAPDFHYKTEALFSEFPVPRNLLGHSSFLDHAALALRSKFGLIYLNPEA